MSIINSDSPHKNIKFVVFCSLSITAALANSSQARASENELWEVNVNKNNTIASKQLTSSQELVDNYNPKYYPTSYGVIQKEKTLKAKKKSTVFILNISTESQHYENKNTDQQMLDSLCNDHLLGDLEYSQENTEQKEYSRRVITKTCNQNTAQKAKQADYQKRFDKSVYNWHSIYANNPNWTPKEYHNYI